MQIHTISDSAVNYDLPVCLFAYCALVCNKIISGNCSCIKLDYSLNIFVLHIPCIAVGQRTQYTNEAGGGGGGVSYNAFSDFC